MPKGAKNVGGERPDNVNEYIYRGLRRSVLDEEPLRLTLVNELDLPEIDKVTVERESLDARHKPRVEAVYNLRFTVTSLSPRLKALLREGRVQPYEPPSLPQPEPEFTLPERPVIVGCGPAGLFVGLDLARKGYRPILLERGQPVAQRARDIEALWSRGDLDPESNMQFGEGGAGTFSDGKLSTGKASALDDQIIEAFIIAGAPESIRYSHRPHIGTDYLRGVVTNLRREIEAAGGEVRFGARLEDVHLRGSAVEAITVSGQREATECLILAIGHSARDTAAMLHQRGVAMEPKPFAIGARIEHPAALIDEAQYGREAAAVLPAADYKLTHRHRDASGASLSVYTFCMCPGGQVVCAASEPGGQVTNGMSRYARDAAYSNSAVVVGIDPARLSIHSPMQALLWQRELEQRAYRVGGGGYIALAQRASDLLAGRVSQSLPDTSYRPGVTSAALSDVLPAFVIEAMAAALRRFDRIIPGFVDQGLLIGVESRTSSPLRMVRDARCQSVSVQGLYLLGEGAGYAGGIMTCARDALRFAQRIGPRR
jgi:uncharacterized protein